MTDAGGNAYDPLADLNETQMEKYRRMVEFVEENVSDPKDKAFCDAACICRYLRARDYKVKKSSKLLLETLQWRKDFGVETLDPEPLSDDNLSGKVYVHGKDREGRPVLYMHPGRENTKNWKHGVKLLVYMMEKAISMMDSERGVEKMVVIINFNGYKLFEPPLPTSMEVNKIIANHYPERLHRAFMVDPPWYFTVFWKAISPFVHEVTKQKLRFVKGSLTKKRDALLEDFGDPAGFEKWVGGDDPHEYDHSVYWTREMDAFRTRVEELA